MKKYDVAISVAVEDTEVSDALAAELKALNVKYYYYKEMLIDSVGQDIIKLTLDTYGKHSRYVLLITSRVFVEKYWSSVETQVAISKLKRGNILQLRLDDTPVDGISRHVVYMDWKENPEEIAKVIYEKVKRRKRRVKWMWLRIGLYIWGMVIMGEMCMWGIRRMNDAYNLKEQRIAVDGSHYEISNVEVTVAAYKEYCMKTNNVFPTQPFSSVDSMPVRNVTWEEAKAYCNYVGGRLPTEAEWRKAAEAGQSTIYSGGTSAAFVAIYHKVKPAFVGRRKANAWGIYDMSGNVAEWCYDWADAAKTKKVVKGGGYDSDVEELAVDARREELPDARLRDVGFRVVWDKID